MTRSTDISTLTNRAMCERLESMPPHEFARLTQAEFNAAWARIEQSRLLRAYDLRWTISVVPAALVMVLLWLAEVKHGYAPATPVLPSMLLYLPVFVVALPIAVILTKLVCIVGGAVLLKRLDVLLTPLGQAEDAGGRVQQMMASPSAQVYRGAVLETGRELCRQDLVHMERLQRDDADAFGTDLTNTPAANLA